MNYSVLIEPDRGCLKMFINTGAIYFQTRPTRIKLIESLCMKILRVTKHKSKEKKIGKYSKYSKSGKYSKYSKSPLRSKEEKN